MIICSASNIDLIQGQGTEGYGNADGTTDWRITNTPSATLGLTGVFNIFNSVNPTTPSISILESGTVGIGTVPNVSSAAKMEIIGGINISGSYNINNRDVINDTSNYILNTSNILVSRINAGGGSGGAITSGGNLTLTNNATSNTVLSIANSNIVIGTTFIAAFADNVLPATHAIVTAAPTDRYMIFTNTSNIGHTFTVPVGGINCDILMIGGGGGGGHQDSGGGSGACIVAINQTLPAGICKVVVGIGGVGGGSSTNGGDSSISIGGTFRYLAKGGGAGRHQAKGNDGGSGAGGGMALSGGDIKVGGDPVSSNIVVLPSGLTSNVGPCISSTFAVYGNKGGTQFDTSGIVNSQFSAGSFTSAGGGGIGTKGSDHADGTNENGSPGGDGLYQVTINSQLYNFRVWFADSSTTFGVKNGSTNDYYIGGGGAGHGYSGTDAASGKGGLGGGGNSVVGSVSVTSPGTPNTGSGGGGFGVNGSGGSGIIIIRYRSISSINPNTLGTPSIELVRGITGDSNLDYKLGNYNGDFKVISSISNTDTERLLITSSGNVGIGTTNPVNELHFFDSLTSSTSLTIQNSNISFITTPVITPTNVSGGTFTVGQTTGSIDRFMIFTAGTSSFTVPAGGIICDILMIGGGGAGGNAGGGGGGAGACIVSINQSFTTGTYNVAVGAGDVASAANTGAGGDSTIAISGGSTLYIARGGGRGEYANNGRSNGGCGGGSGFGAIKTGGTALNTNMVAGTVVDANSRSSTFAVFGNKGGDRPDTTSGVTGTGGGGIGGAGGNHILTPININAGPGGVGLFQATVGGMTYNFRNYFANGGTPFNFGILNSVDNNYYIGGGGGGSVLRNSLTIGPNVGGVGGAGGGGNGGITSTFVAATGAAGPAVNPTAGATNTGSGGGGGWFNNGGTVQSGGSGIVIIRYRVAPVTIGVPSVELVRGVAGDSNHDFKLGNYNGDFKIMSAVSGTADVERLNISSVGNVGIGTSSPANELHIFDNTTTATSLIIQNNNLITTTNTVQGTSTVQGSVTTNVETTGQVAFVVSINNIIHEQVTSSNDRIMIFTTANYDYTFTIPSGGLVCDILMIGGGGGCGWGAGGAGACIVAINQALPAGSCVVNVGAGRGTSNGDDSFIKVDNTDRYRAKGGGGSGGQQEDQNKKGIDGGCGSGATYNTDNVSENGGNVVNTNVVSTSSTTTITTGPNFTSTYAVMGNIGGYNKTTGYTGAGGGLSDSGGADGKGGDGAYGITINSTWYNFRNYFANGRTSFGVRDGTTDNYYIGGGAGAFYGIDGEVFSPYNGGKGGGAGVNNQWSSGVPNTGSGGHGGTSGGSGIIIIRYKYRTVLGTIITPTTTTTYTHTPTLTTTLSTPTLLGNSSIELVRGTQGDSNTDYKLGNYGGDFKVISSSLSTDTDRLNITSAGNVGIGTTSPQVKLHVTGEVYATGNITAYFSDERLKTKISSIHNPLEIIRKLNGFYYIPNDLAHFNGITNADLEIGLSAQEVQRVLPEIVKIAPFDSVRNTEGAIVSKSGENYLTMSYGRLTPVFVEAIKELGRKNAVLSQEITLIKEKMNAMNAMNAMNERSCE